MNSAIGARRADFRFEKPITRHGPCQPEPPLDIFRNGNIISDMSRTSVASNVFSAIAEPRRRQIIDLLLRRRSLAVGTIVMTLGLPQPAVSKHLGVLREVGIVSVSKQGQQRVYELNIDQLRPVYDWIKTFEQHWDRQLDRIQARAERRALELSDKPPRATRKKGTS
jgi:DNA-binding transcriptional ArsR family regulator